MDKITLDGNEVSKKFITSLKGAEASFSMKKDKGVWTVDMQTISSNNSLNTSDAGSSGVPNGHLHPYAASLIGHDLSYSFGGKWTHLGRVNNGALVSQPDFNRARDQNKTFGTQYNIMININSIILYNASGNNPIYINR